MRHVDLSGREVVVGDFIVYAALWDRSATLKYGRVVEVSIRETRDVFYGVEEKKKTPILKVVTADRDHAGRWHVQNGKKTVSLAYLDRLLVVTPNQLPKKVKELLR